MLTLKVTEKENGTYTVEADLFCIVQWERKYKRAPADLLQAPHIEWLAFLAWEACKQSGVKVPMVLDDYMRRLISVEPVDTDTNPTDGAPTDAD